MKMDEELLSSKGIMLHGRVMRIIDYGICSIHFGMDVKKPTSIVASAEWHWLQKSIRNGCSK